MTNYPTIEMKTLISEKYIWLAFLTVSVLLRLFSFFPSVLDHDESTYLIIGREILQGKELYTDVTDTKPAGIFLFYFQGKQGLQCWQLLYWPYKLSVLTMKF